MRKPMRRMGSKTIRIGLDDALVFPLLSAPNPADCVVLLPHAKFTEPGHRLDFSLYATDTLVQCEPYRLDATRGETHVRIGYDMDRMVIDAELDRPAARDSTFDTPRAASRMPAHFSRMSLMVRFSLGQEHQLVRPEDVTEAEARLLVASPAFEASPDFLRGGAIPPSTYKLGLRNALRRTWGEEAMVGWFWRVPVLVRGRWRPAEMDAMNELGWRMSCQITSKWVFLHHDAQDIRVGVDGDELRQVLTAMRSLSTRKLDWRTLADRCSVLFRDGGNAYASVEPAGTLRLSVPDNDFLRRLCAALSKKGTSDA